MQESISSTLNVQIFRTNAHFSSFYYVDVTRKNCQNDVRTKNARILGWWNWRQVYFFNAGFLFTLPIQNSIKSLFVICWKVVTCVQPFFATHKEAKNWYTGQFNKLRWNKSLKVLHRICYKVLNGLSFDPLLNKYGTLGSR